MPPHVKSNATRWLNASTASEADEPIDDDGSDHVSAQSEKTARRKVPKEVPQQAIDRFWRAFTTKYPGKVHTILPQDVYARRRAARQPQGPSRSRDSFISYDEAKAQCIAAVDKIARECRRVNMRYRDLHFDIEFDLKSNQRDCLNGLLLCPAGQPKSVKRVHQIFENPQFYIDGPTSNDIRQGRVGDCWFLAALEALSNKEGLIDRVCVHRDENVGVYGFVFHRDGEWIYTVIDDKLYLSVPDWDESLYEKVSWLQIPNRQDAEEEYRRSYQTGSRSLYFAQCTSENETWLPLLEKAYAKAHNDYSAIQGGFTGEAIEDLTGGVTTELFTSDILDTDKFWRDELLKVNKDFLFGCATGRYDDWQGGGMLTDRSGIFSGHAYSIMKAREVRGERLLQIRNPWGDSEWNGAWSDGSEQWTPEWMQLLDHQFGNDGVFWISYKDLLRKYQFFDRTRLFNRKWKVSQAWTTVDVPWTADYNDTKFVFTLSHRTSIVIMLSQLDDRYWNGLHGQYHFSLHFRLNKDGEDGYIVRSHGNYSMTRSVSTELELEPGSYSVLMKITARRYQLAPTVEDVVRMNCRDRQEKLLQVGLAYDLAHAQAADRQTAESRRQAATLEAKQEQEKKEEEIEAAKKLKWQTWNVERKKIERRRREKARHQAHQQHKTEREAKVPSSQSSSSPSQAKSVRQKEIPDGTTHTHNKEARNSEQPPSQPLKAPREPNKGNDKLEHGHAARKSKKAAKHPHADEPRQDNPPVSNGSPIESETIKLPLRGATDAEHETNTGDETKSPKTVDASTPDASNETPNATASDSETIYSFCSSVDSDLDPELFDEDAQEMARRLPAPPTSRGSNGSENSVAQTGPIDTNISADQEDDEDPPNESKDEGNGEDNATDDDLAEFADDPWNAVCVIGLRLYTRHGDVTVAVQRPKSQPAGEQSPLDLDDPSKGASAEPAQHQADAGEVGVVTEEE